MLIIIAILISLFLLFYLKSNLLKTLLIVLISATIFTTYLSNNNSNPPIEDQQRYIDPLQYTQVYNSTLGEDFEYTVQPGDTFTSIYGKFMMEPDYLLYLNQDRITNPNNIQVGAIFKVSNKHIVPELPEEGILVDRSVPSSYFIQNSNIIKYYPIAVGKDGWETPLGNFQIINKIVDPIWWVPESIQEEMEENGEEVVTFIPPGPDNPLGKYWIGFYPAYGIHGTNKPSSIGQFTTHGCLRHFNDDIEYIFNNTELGDPVKIIAEQIKIANIEGKIFLEIHQIPDGHIVTLDEVLQVLNLHNFTDQVDLNIVYETVTNAWGTPIDITLNT